MKKLNLLTFFFIISFGPNVFAGGTDCGSGECPVLERAKDVGDAALKDLAPYIGVAVVVALASSDSLGNDFISQVDKNPYKKGIQMVDVSEKYSIDMLSFRNSYSFDPLKKNTYSFNLLEVKYKFN